MMRTMMRTASSKGVVVLYMMLLFSQISALLALSDGLLINGDFEETSTTSGSLASVEGWMTKGEVEVVQAGQRQGAMTLVIPHGTQAVKLTNDAEISQTVKVEKGSLYSLTFNAARTCAQAEALNVTVPPSSSQVIDLQTLYNVRGWDAYATAFVAGDESVTVMLVNTGMEDDPACGPILDDIAIKKLVTPDKPKGSVVINGDFEEGPWLFPNHSLGVLLPTNFDGADSPLPAWNIDSNKAVRFIDSHHYAVPEGKRAVELLSGKEGIISQMVKTRPNKPYRMSFLVGHAEDKCGPPLAVRAFAADQADTVHYYHNASSAYQEGELNFTAKAEDTRIAFYSVYYNVRKDDRTSMCGPVIDSVRVWASSGGTVLMMFGLKGLLGFEVIGLWVLGMFLG